ncbi:MAG: hypothetical protein KAW09_07500, partial [Thermoplasmata archaeon]|nr:hypothetical protein [Thermoplasmata archaeon]
VVNSLASAFVPPRPSSPQVSSMLNADDMEVQKVTGPPITARDRFPLDLNVPPPSGHSSYGGYATNQGAT